MSKQIIDLRDELRQLKFENGLLQKIDSSKDDSKIYNQLKKRNEKLPDGVFEYKSMNGEPLNMFYSIYESDLTEQEKKEYFLLKQTASITTIRNYFIILTIFVVIYVIFSFVTRFII